MRNVAAWKSGGIILLLTDATQGGNVERRRTYADEADFNGVEAFEGIGWLLVLGEGSIW